LTSHEPSQFDEPWQAEALALAMALIDCGQLNKTEWAASLGATVAAAADDADDGSKYYDHVLAAVEQIALARSFVTAEMLRARKEAWRAAYLATPHGKPVVLSTNSRKA
jgi:nitrile hydratase accessory protein